MNNNKSCEYIFNKNKIKSMSIFRLFTESISIHNMNDISDKIYNSINFDEKQYKSFILKHRYSCFFHQIHGLFLDTLLKLFLSLRVNNRKNSLDFFLS